MKLRMYLCLALGAVTFLVASDAYSQGRSRYPERDESRSAVSRETIRATFTVRPGQKIQEAVDRAQPGDRIEVLPGVYHETVSVDFDDIELIGVIENGEMPIFDGRDKLNDAVLAAGNDFYIANFEMRNYQGNGVVVNQARNCTFVNLVCDSTGKYGVYPVLCDGVLIEDCVVSNVWDAGIYAGQCRNVVIRNCETFFNTIGIEAENSVNVLMSNNSAHDNSVGLLVVLLPNLPTKTATDALVVKNRVYNNNYPNLAPSGHMVSVVEPGLGIVISAADSTEVTKNRVEGNESFGIAVYGLSDSMPDKELDVEPDPDGNFIHGNQLARNGGKVNSRLKGFGVTGTGGDLYWSGRGRGNGFNEKGATSFPERLPAWTGGIVAGGGL